MNKESKRISIDNNVDLRQADVPFATLSGGAHIEIFGNSRLVLEGKYLITEFTENLIKIKSGKRYITITGQRISLSNLSGDGFLLSGKFSKIEFE